ncbi:hypothetical protein [Microbacterium sp. No. 7]|uniref:hypothetical protein n=1 Tax=Microbacterium sp. No. 7 TaxID=1714373 RepID=UPI0006D01A56|nr:hypothetical protein [Microbacterium sp. No. 7]ALJ19433.1 hypothetical protein AOA12_05730 [Microbacterium sp. No. 7]
MEQDFGTEGQVSDTADTDGFASRRTIVKGAAWSVPVIAAAISAPLAAATTTITPTSGAFDELRYGWPDTSSSGRMGKYANGVTYTLLDESGSPVPGVHVTFTITDFDDNSIWFFSDPTIPPGPGSEIAAPQLSTITLVTDGSGQISLNGYLRRGSDANSPDSSQNILASATVGGVTTTATARWALSSTNSNFGNDDPTVTGPADEAQHVRRSGSNWP